MSVMLDIGLLQQVAGGVRPTYVTSVNHVEITFTNGVTTVLDGEIATAWHAALAQLVAFFLAYQQQLGTQTSQAEPVADVAEEVAEETVAPQTEGSE